MFDGLAFDSFEVNLVFQVSKNSNILSMMFVLSDPLVLSQLKLPVQDFHSALDV